MSPSSPSPSPERAAPCAAGPCLARRAFLADAVQGAAAAVLLAACGGGDGPVDPSAARPEERTIDVTLALASTPALASVGGIVRTGSGLRTVAVVRTAADRFRAFSMLCPHAGSLVEVEDRAFVCRNHGSRFAADGGLVRGPATTGLVELTATFDAAAQAVRVTGRV